MVYDIPSIGGINVQATQLRWRSGESSALPPCHLIPLASPTPPTRPLAAGVTAGAHGPAPVWFCSQLGNHAYAPAEFF